MSFQYAVLGLLSWQPLTGYDIKKLIKDLPFMYWTANNNQIYKTLVQLHKDELVSNRTEHQEGAPSKKIYDITESGQDALDNWILSSEPELPEMKKNFLIQLAWSGELNNSQLNELLNKYKEEIQLKLLFIKEKQRREVGFPNRSKKEHFLWYMIFENLIGSYETEILWTDKIMDGLDKQGF